MMSSFFWTSPWTFSLGAQYDRKIWEHDSFFRVDYEFQGQETGLTPERDPATTLFDGGLVPEPQTNMLKMRAGATVKSINFTLFMDNVLNSHPVLGLNHQDDATLLYEASTFRPRTFGLTATYRY